MVAMPSTIVRKMIGAITIFTRFTNVSPSGFIARPADGRTTPSSTPSAMATSTWTVRLFPQPGGARRAAAAGSPSFRRGSAASISPRCGSSHGGS